MRLTQRARARARLQKYPGTFYVTGLISVKNGFLVAATCVSCNRPPRDTISCAVGAREIFRATDSRSEKGREKNETRREREREREGEKETERNVVYARAPPHA